MLCLDNDDVGRERENLATLIARGVDGIILFYIGGEDNLDCLQDVKAAGIPLVLVDRYIHGVETHYVVTDNFYGAYEATSRLIEGGFDKISTSASPPLSSPRSGRGWKVTNRPARIMAYPPTRSRLGSSPTASYRT